MHEVAGRVRAALRDVPGIRVECKGVIVALHTQGAAPDAAVWSRFQLLGAAAELVNAGVVRALRGHEVLELLPNVGCSRADALRTVRTCVETRNAESTFIVYVCGDLADDESVRVMQENGVAVAIGGRTHAPYRVEPRDIDALLEALIAVRSRPPRLSSGRQR
jgi:trehalose-6-phosphatase